MARSTTHRLAGHQRRYRELAAQLADIGYITAGSITQRHTRCANQNCRCHADLPQMHGPYWQWTAKVGGKTVTRRLSDTEAALYQEWIANDRQLRALITQMRQVATEATKLIMDETKNRTTKVQSQVELPHTHVPGPCSSAGLRPRAPSWRSRSGAGCRFLAPTRLRRAWRVRTTVDRRTVRWAGERARRDRARRRLVGRPAGRPPPTLEALAARRNASTPDSA